MLNDIFSKSKAEQRKQALKPKITADIHEKDSLVLANLANEAELEIINLEIGDYMIGNTVIERKTFRDFVSSMLSKRLIQQLQQMQAYENKLLVLEGKDFEELENTQINPNAIRGMILSISLDFKTPIIFTKDSEDTARFLLVLAKRQLKNPTEMSFHSRKPMAKRKKLEYILESFSNIGPMNAKKLLKKFKTIKNIINAKLEELEAEIGKKSESFKIIDEEY